MKTALTFLTLSYLVSCAPLHKVYNPPRRMVVRAPVANVRSEPVPHSGEYKYDPKQETQVEKGEPILVLERKKKWFKVEVPEQLEYTHNSRWEGYPGWVPAKALSTDLILHHQLARLNLPEEDLRAKILENAAKHLGSPYLWGGRSLYEPEINKVATGVDCSGLVNWSFRQTGWFIPRDAHEQSLKARRIPFEELKPADLIFLAKPENPEKIVHVMFFAGENSILEAPQSGEKVRKMTIQDRFGKPLSDVNNGDQVQDRIVFFGTFF